MKYISSILTLLIGLSCLIPSVGWTDVTEPTMIPTVRTVPPATWEVDSTLRHERGRFLGEGIQYNNTAVQPVGLRFGLIEGVELGMASRYVANEGVDSDFPGNSGLEGIFLHTLIRLHQYSSLRVEAGFRGRRNIYPGGTERLQFAVQAPVYFPIARGWFHGFGGVRLRFGEAIRNGSPIASWQNQIEGGFGYVVPVNHNFVFSTEVVGASRPLNDAEGDFGGFEGEDLLELVFGTQVRLGRTSVFNPSIGFGLLRGSPAWSLGLAYRYRFGEAPDMKFRRREEPKWPRRPAPKPPMSEVQEDSSEDTEASQQPRETEADTVGQLIRRGMKAFRLANYERAIDLLERASRMDPDRADLNFNLGSLYFRMENYRRAAQYYRGAVKQNPDDAEAHLYLGASLSELGNFERAQRHFDRVIDLTDRDDRIRRWMRQLQS